MHSDNLSIKLHKKGILNIILFIIFLWSLFSVDWGKEVIHSGGVATILQIFHGLLHPDLSPEILKLAVISTWRTLAYATAGMTLAIIIALVFGILASGILCDKKRTSLLCMSFFRGFLSFMRSIHELVWALLFVAAVGLSPYVAIFALGISYGGALGRIYADILNDVPRKPINSLISSGASPFQILFYGYLPMALPNMISYTMYRLECAVRSSTIMSFVGLGGLGYQIHLSLSDLEYAEVWTFMFFLLGLVLIIDIWSNALRKRLVK